jgi:hypothetical protein
MTNEDITRGLRGFNEVVVAAVNRCFIIEKFMLDGGLNLWKGILAYINGKYVNIELRYLTISLDL